jgi:hypothetical protein
MLAPPRPPVPEELEALIREARARQRRRRLIAATAVAVAAAAGLVTYAVLGFVSQSGKLHRVTDPSAVAPLSRCRSRQLRLGRPQFNGAYTGHAITNYVVTNTSAATCVLRGWPALGVMLHGRRLALHTGHGRNLGLPVGRVVLGPGGAASFNVVTSDFDPGNNMGPWPCTGSSFVLLVTPPGGRAPLRLPVYSHYCGPLHGEAFTVTPLVAGKLDRYEAG